MAAAGGRATPEHCNATSFNWWFFTIFIGFAFSIFHMPMRSKVSFSIQDLRILGKVLKSYTEKHNGQLPDTANWWDTLLEYEPKSFDVLKNEPNTPEEFFSDCAFNANLSERKLSEIPKDMVLLFETKPGRNPTGVTVLANTSKYPIKGCFVLFADMHIEFIRAEDFTSHPKTLRSRITIQPS
jgi:hypothetical protein